MSNFLMNKHIKYNFFLVILPLLIGIIPYQFEYFKDHLLFIRNYIPDLLWSFSCASALMINKLPNHIKYISALITITTGFIFEFCQINIFYGTFDPFDLIAYVFGSIFALMTSFYIDPKTKKFLNH